MRSSFLTLSMAALLAGATALSLALPVDAAHAQKKKKQKEERPDISKDFLEPFNAANDAIGKQDIATAEAQIAIATAKATTPDDKFYLGNATVRLGGLKQDKGLQRQGLELMLDSGKAPAAEIPRFNYLAGVIAYEEKNYAAAEGRLRQAIELGHKEQNIELIYADTIFQQDRVPEGLAILRSLVDAKRAAGESVDESYYRRAVQNAVSSNMAEETTYWTQQWLTDYPSSNNWRDSLVLMRQNYDLPNNITIDVLRLMRVAGALTSERDYADYIETADVRLQPGEVLSLIEEGMTSGSLQSSDTFFSENVSLAKERIDEDRASLNDTATEARNSSSPQIAIGTADAYLGYKQYDKAVELYSLALQKPGVDSNLVNMRLGISEAMRGNYDAARTSLGAVTGQRAMVAKFWMVWIDNQPAQ